MAQKASLPQIVAELEHHCQAQHTGILRMLAGKNVSASFVLKEGHILAAQYGDQQGEQALAQIAQIQTCIVKFIQDVEQEVPAVPIPANEVIFQRLLGEGSAPMGSNTAASPITAKSLTAAHKAVLEELLADQIGPMAQIICPGVFATASNPEAAVAALAQEIPDDTMRKHFLAEAQKKL